MAVKPDAQQLLGFGIEYIASTFNKPVLCNACKKIQRYRFLVFSHCHLYLPVPDNHFQPGVGAMVHPGGCQYG